MTFAQLQKQSPALATLFTACGYTEQSAQAMLLQWSIVEPIRYRNGKGVGILAVDVSGLYARTGNEMATTPNPKPRTKSKGGKTKRR